MDADFLRVMPLIFRDEGGFQKDPNDKGNYRPNGTLIGTNFGISAASYPELDIAALTAPQAQQIYYVDWWQHYKFGELPWPLSGKVFDIAINMGGCEAIELFQDALLDLNYRIVTDGIIGPATAASAVHANEPQLFAHFVTRVEDHYKSIVHNKPRDQKYLKGWLARAEELMPK